MSKERINARAFQTPLKVRCEGMREEEEFWKGIHIS